MPSDEYNIEKRKYRGIKVPEDTYENINALKEIILQKGLNSLSKDFINYTPQRCPKCNTEMDSAEITIGSYHCPNPDCHFEYPKFKLGLGGSLAMGTLIGLMIAGIIYLLTKKD